jgi:hypothetical protein
MGDFTFYFKLGFEHIMSPDALARGNILDAFALDHILFVTALCLRYLWKDWSKVIILVTAFTIGHSVTLALSALNYVHFSTDWIEFLIPLTIAATCINNIVQRGAEQTARLPLIYFFALFFGMIHGLAFAGQFRSLEGKKGLVAHLLAFNLGIEAAQLVVVLVILLLSWLLVQLLKLPRLVWLRGASVVILVLSLIWAYERFPYNKNYNDEKTIVLDGGRMGNV